jgi:hypothetical protein
LESELGSVEQPVDRAAPNKIIAAIASLPKVGACMRREAIVETGEFWNLDMIAYRSVISVYEPPDPSLLIELSRRKVKPNPEKIT